MASTDLKVEINPPNCDFVIENKIARPSTPLEKTNCEIYLKNQIVPSNISVITTSIIIQNKSNPQNNQVATNSQVQASGQPSVLGVNTFIYQPLASILGNESAQFPYITKNSQIDSYIYTAFFISIIIGIILILVIILQKIKYSKYYKKIIKK